MPGFLPDNDVDFFSRTGVHNTLESFRLVISMRFFLLHDTDKTFWEGCGDILTKNIYIFVLNICKYIDKKKVKQSFGTFITDEAVYKI